MFLKRLFKKKSENEGAGIWHYPESEPDLEKIFASKTNIQCIYKHSTTCATSLFAMRHVEKVLPGLQEDVDFYYIDVRRNRPLSKKVAEWTGIRHESPQILMIKHGNVLWHASHSDIRQGKIMEAFHSVSGKNTH